MRSAFVLCVALAAATVAARPWLKPNPSVWSEEERDAWCSHNGILTPQCGGFIGGIVWAGTPTNCSFVLLDNENDKTRVVDPVNAVCADHRAGVTDVEVDATAGFTAYDTPTKQILFASGDGATVWGVTVTPGKGPGYKALASLPTQYPPLIGLAVANGIGADGGWYVVTTQTLYAIDAPSESVNSVMDLDSLQLSAEARVTAFNTTLYIIDGLSVHTIDLIAFTAVRTAIVDGSLATAQTIQFWPTNNTLVTVSSDRVVTQIDLTSGRSYPILGPLSGSGTIDRSTNFFDMYFITDQSNMYLINLAAKTLEVTAAWPGANTKGYIQYYY